MSERPSSSPEQFHAPTAAPEKLHRPEKSGESPARNHEIDKEDVRAEVAEILKKAERRMPHTNERTPQTKAHLIAPKQKDAAFNRTMRSVQQEMAPPSKTFSKFIHHPVIESTSEVVGKTIARPTSILYGSLCAFIVMSGVYLLAKHNGFRLSGSEFIILFAAGWLIGLIVDAVQTAFSRR